MLYEILLFAHFQQLESEQNVKQDTKMHRQVWLDIRYASEKY